MNENVVDVLMHHPLATQNLKGLLKSIGSPQKSWEEKTVANVAKVYGKMGKKFPSPKLSADLDALYSKAKAIADAMQAAMGSLINNHTSLTLECMGLTTCTLTAATQEEFAIEWSKAFHHLDMDCAVVIELYRELCFLTLEAAVKRIHAALKNGTQK